MFLLLPGWDAVPLQGYTHIKFASVHWYTWAKRGTVRIKSFTQQHNTVALPRAETQTAGSRDKCIVEGGTKRDYKTNWGKAMTTSMP